MISILLCGLIAVVCFITGRRSLAAGLTAVLSVGYVYGIARANLAQTGSHFLFDAAVVGLFAARLTVRRDFEAPRAPRHLVWWVTLLVAWPFLLMAIPKQDPMVQLVGFRGNAFLLPFILLGAQLSDDDRYRLALSCAVLNILAFGVALAEFQVGVSAFFPRNAVTSIIFMSNDVGAQQNYRIPSTFGSAHAYGGTMVMTLPFILGAWLRPRKNAVVGIVLATSILAASVGVFMSAARSHALLLFAFIGFATIASRMTLLGRAGWFTLLAVIALLVASDERLQRFLTLSDTAFVAERVGWSVNSGFLESAVRYPLGNGLASGGTSIPFFLMDRVPTRQTMENEYGRIMIEQGVPGLLVWLSFILWTLSRRHREPDNGWRNARTLGWCVAFVSFGSALIGTGLLTSVPQTAIFLLTVGWIASKPSAAAPVRDMSGRRHDLAMAPRQAQWT